MSELGRVAYEAYYRNIGKLGGPLMFWPELDEQVRVAWDAAADAVATAQIQVDLNSGDLEGGF